MVHGQREAVPAPGLLEGLGMCRSPGFSHSSGVLSTCCTRGAPPAELVPLAMETGINAGAVLLLSVQGSSQGGCEMQNNE